MVERARAGRARVLVADDEESVRVVLREALGDAGHAVIDVADGDAALTALASGSFDVAFLDIRMPGPSGLELLDRVRAIGCNTAVVIITALNTFENAVEAMKRGALDYLVKPFRMEEVAALVAKALRAQALQEEVRSLRREVAQRAGPGERLVGRNPALLEIFKTIGRVAGSDVPVLVTGESGTGKELVARAIHGAGPRAEGPFVPVNTAAIPRELLESEMFGHERGAFTGAVEARLGRVREAAGGTLFLDEIGDMPPELQAKILRVLQSGEVVPVGARGAERVSVRIVAATHRDLDADVREGRFREDLLYRLRVVPIHIPPLRERPDDVPVLAEHFVARYSEELGTGPKWLADATLDRLREYRWPGNVRELENAIKRALVLSSGEVLAPEDFAFLGAGSGTGEADRSEAESEDALASLIRSQVEVELAERSSLERAGPSRGVEEAEETEEEAAERGERGDLHRRILERAERPMLDAVLERTGWNQIRAAAILGINRNTLRKKITELGIKRRDRS